MGDSIVAIKDYLRTLETDQADCDYSANDIKNDNDPEQAKPAVDFLPFDRSSFPTRCIWLIGLETKSSNEFKYTLKYLQKKTAL